MNENNMININADDLRTVAEETKDKRLGRFSAEYYQLSYDPRTGELKKGHRENERSPAIIIS